jgi:hypothetical protein
MNFNKLYSRVVYNETKEKQPREEDVEQYDHSASVAEQEEEYYDYDYDDRRVYKWSGEDVIVEFPDRAEECVVEGVVEYTVEDEPPAPENRWEGGKWPEIEGVEVTGIFEAGDEHKDPVDITKDVTFEEMEIAERALIDYFEKYF